MQTILSISRLRLLFTLVADLCIIMVWTPTSRMTSAIKRHAGCRRFIERDSVTANETVTDKKWVCNSFPEGKCAICGFQVRVLVENWLWKIGAEIIFTPIKHCNWEWHRLSTYVYLGSSDHIFLYMYVHESMLLAFVLYSMKHVPQNVFIINPRSLNGIIL